MAATVRFYRSFLKPHLTEETYRKYREACLKHWEAYDRHKEVRYWVDSSKWIDKGFREFNEQGNAFEQGLIRNLLMYEAERHEPDGQPERFLQYAQECTGDIIANWDFQNPWHMWSMRNAEHITPQALALFLMMAPDQCPSGAREKLSAWRDYIVSRTNNLWHYRTHSDDEWAISNRAWMSTVTFSTVGSHRVRILDSASRQPVASARPGNAVILELRAALNQDWSRAETGYVLVRADAGPAVKVTVTETGPNTGVFQARYPVPAAQEISVSYGFLGFEKRADLKIM